MRTAYVTSHIESNLLSDYFDHVEPPRSFISKKQQQAKENKKQQESSEKRGKNRG